MYGAKYVADCSAKYARTHARLPIGIPACKLFGSTGSAQGAARPIADLHIALARRRPSRIYSGGLTAGPFFKNSSGDPSTYPGKLFHVDEKYR
jgi:hypothetical protein